MEKNVGFIISGFLGLCSQLVALMAAIYWTTSSWSSIMSGDIIDILIVLICIFWFFASFGGYVVVGINKAYVVSFMGKYKGTMKNNGWYFINPFYGVTNVNLAVVNQSTGTIEVNEKTGVPIQICTVISYKIIDTYKFNYNISDTEQFIHNKFGSSLRDFAKRHTYQELSELDHSFVDLLNQQLQDIGINVLDSKITQLNYVEAIAASMLQKQQAQSLSDARETLVTNAVKIAANASVVILDQRIKEQFMADLIIVLCSHAPVTPTISVGKN